MATRSRCTDGQEPVVVHPERLAVAVGGAGSGPGGEDAGWNAVIDRRDAVVAGSVVLDCHRELRDRLVTRVGEPNGVLASFIPYAAT
jgi:hypothetical protein